MDQIRFKILEEILKIACKINGVSIDQSKSKTRATEVVNARKMFCAYILSQTDIEYTLEEIGDHVNVEHCSVLYYKAKSSDHCETEPEYYEKYQRVLGAATDSYELKVLISEATQKHSTLKSEDLVAAIELIRSKMEILQRWLLKYVDNPYRTKVQRDLRHLEGELQSKMDTAAKLNQLTA